MRIALIVPGGVDRSGERRVIPALLALIGRLALAHEVHVIALAQELRPDTWRLVGAVVHNIGAGRTGWRALRALRSLHRHATFDLVHAVWSGTCGAVAAVAGRWLAIPALVHVAGGELVSLPEVDYGGARTLRGRVRETLVLRSAQAVTTASAPTLAALARIGIRAARVPLGVDLSAWPPRPPERRALGRPARLIHVASLNRVKDQSTLLQAMSALRSDRVPFELDIVGEDTLGGRIQAEAARLGLTDIRFHGFKSQRELRPLVESADLMVISSRHETGPVAVLEAAVAGVPTVGTAVGHLAEWAPDAALAVPVADPARLAGAVRRMLEDEELRWRLAAAAFVRAIREDADYTARQFENLYRQLVRGQSAADGGAPCGTGDR